MTEVVATHKLIAHALIQHRGQYLLIRRSRIKRGQPNVYPDYWDIPGGGVEAYETPRQAALREVVEETGLTVRLRQLLHEDSQLDQDKGLVFTRLVYAAELLADGQNIQLDPEEHTAYRWVKGQEEMADLSVVPYVEQLFEMK